MPEPAPFEPSTRAINCQVEALRLAREVIERFGLADLRPMLRAIETRMEQEELNLGIFGRFKAGKSSFLNHLIGRAILPVGVIPVTSVVTEIGAGREETAAVAFKNGRATEAIFWSRCMSCSGSIGTDFRTFVINYPRRLSAL